MNEIEALEQQIRDSMPQTRRKRTKKQVLVDIIRVNELRKAGSGVLDALEEVRLCPLTYYHTLKRIKEIK